MSDTPDPSAPQDPAADHEAAAETPIERALRLKRAAQATRGRGPAAGFDRKAAARQAAGASRPWLKK